MLVDSSVPDPAGPRRKTTTVFKARTLMRDASILGIPPMGPTPAPLQWGLGT